MPSFEKALSSKIAHRKSNKLFPFVKIAESMEVLDCNLSYSCLYFRMQLFAEDSPLSKWDEDLTAVITPCGKGDNFFDSGFKSDLSVSDWSNVLSLEFIVIPVIILLYAKIAVRNETNTVLEWIALSTLKFFIFFFFKRSKKCHFSRHTLVFLEFFVLPRT